MTKLLYSQSTQQTYTYPRSDDQPIVGLDPDYLVLNKVEGVVPTYDPQTESLYPNWVVDLNNLEYRQEWTVSPIEQQPDWNNFYDQLILSATYQFLFSQTIPYPSITGAMAIMGFAIENGKRDPSNPNRLAAFQSSVTALIGTLNAVGLVLSPEQLSEVRTLLDANGFQSVTLV